MIPLNELRVGHWVTDKESTPAFKLYPYQLEKAKQDYEFFPIQIDETWLSKLGFKKYFNIWYTDDADYVQLEFDGSYVQFIINHKPDGDPVQFVHQL